LNRPQPNLKTKQISFGNNTPGKSQFKLNRINLGPVPPLPSTNQNIPLPKSSIKVNIQNKIGTKALPNSPSPFNSTPLKFASHQPNSGPQPSFLYRKKVHPITLQKPLKAISRIAVAKSSSRYNDQMTRNRLMASSISGKNSYSHNKKRSSRDYYSNKFANSSQNNTPNMTLTDSNVISDFNTNPSSLAQKPLKRSLGSVRYVSQNSMNQIRNFKKTGQLRSSKVSIPKTSIDKQERLYQGTINLKNSNYSTTIKDNSIKNFIFNKYRPKSLKLVYKVKEGKSKGKINPKKESTTNKDQLMMSYSVKSRDIQEKSNQKQLLQYPNILAKGNKDSKRRVRSHQNNRDEVFTKQERNRLLNSNVTNQSKNQYTGSKRDAKKILKTGSPDLRSGLFDSVPQNINNLLQSLELSENDPNNVIVIGNKNNSQKKEIQNKNNLIFKISKELAKKDQKMTNDEKLFVSPIITSNPERNNFLFSTQKYIKSESGESSDNEANRLKRNSKEINNSLLFIGNHLTSILTNINKGNKHENFHDYISDSKHNERMDNLDLIIDELESRPSNNIKMKQKMTKNNRYLMREEDSGTDLVESQVRGNKYEINKKQDSSMSNKMMRSLPPIRSSHKKEKFSSEIKKLNKEQRPLSSFLTPNDQDSSQKNGPGMYRTHIPRNSKGLTSMAMLRNIPHFLTMPKNRSLSHQNNVKIDQVPKHIVQYSMWDQKRSNSRIIHKTREYLYEFLDHTYKDRLNQKNEPISKEPVEEIPKKKIKKKVKKKKAKPKVKSKKVKKKKPKKIKSKFEIDKKFFMTEQPKTKRKKPSIKKKPPQMKKKTKPKKGKKKKNVITRKIRRVTRYVGPKNGPKVKKSVILTTFERKKKPKSRINTGLKKKAKDEYITTVRTSVIFGDSSLGSLSKTKKSAISSSMIQSNNNDKLHESMVLSNSKSQRSFGRRKIKTSTNFYQSNKVNYDLLNQNQSMNQSNKKIQKINSKPSIITNKLEANQSLFFKKKKYSESDLRKKNKSSLILQNPFLIKTNTESTIQESNTTKKSLEELDEKSEEEMEKVKQLGEKEEEFQKDPMPKEAFKTIGDPVNVNPIKTSIEQIMNLATKFKKESGINSIDKSKLASELSIQTTKSENRPSVNKKKKSAKKRHNLKSSRLEGIRQPHTSRKKVKKKSSNKKKMMEAPKTLNSFFHIKTKKKSKVPKKKKKKRKRSFKSVKNLTPNQVSEVPIVNAVEFRTERSIKKPSKRSFRKHSLILGSKKIKANKPKLRSKNHFRSRSSLMMKPAHHKRKQKGSKELTFDEFQALVKKNNKKNKVKKVANFKKKKPNLTIKIENNSVDTMEKETKKEDKKENTKFEDMETPKMNSFRKDNSSEFLEESLIIKSKKIDEPKRSEIKFPKEKGELIDPDCKEYVFNSKKLFIFRNPYFMNVKTLPNGLSLLKDISDFGKKVIEDNLNLITHFEHFDKSIPF
jgi:hypothetical protein